MLLKPPPLYAGCKVYSYDLNIQFHGEDGGAQMHRMALLYKVEIDTYASFNKNPDSLWCQDLVPC